MSIALALGAGSAALTTRIDDIARLCGWPPEVNLVVGVTPDAVLTRRTTLSQIDVTCTTYGTAEPLDRTAVLVAASGVTWSSDPLVGLAAMSMPSPQATTQVTQQGWPIPIVEGRVEFTTGLAPVERARSRVAFRGEEFVLVYGPLPVKLGTSVAGWASVWWFLLVLPPALVRFRRSRAGQCPLCGYARVGLEAAKACPECGFGECVRCNEGRRFAQIHRIQGCAAREAVH